jgi:uncharacterized protein YndB with AHSA1/START domain
VTDVHTEGDATLVFTRDLRHPPEKVWAALTEPARLRRWAPFDADRDLGTPGPATLTMVDGETRTDLPGIVRLAEPPTLLEYTWGADRLRWELTPTDTGTRLVLRHTAEEREWLPKLAAGWHLCLDVAERLLDGEPVEAIRGSAAREHGWDDLHERYTRELSA